MKFEPPQQADIRLALIGRAFNHLKKATIVLPVLPVSVLFLTVSLATVSIAPLSAADPILPSRGPDGTRVPTSGPFNNKGYKIRSTFQENFSYVDRGSMEETSLAGNMEEAEPGELAHISEDNPYTATAVLPSTTRNSMKFLNRNYGNTVQGVGGSGGGGGGGSISVSGGGAGSGITVGGGSGGSRLIDSALGAAVDVN